MISKKDLKIINEQLNFYACSKNMYNDAKTSDSMTLWAKQGLQALKALDAYGIKPNGGADVMRECWQSWVKVSA
jgi:hypothetical protein